MSALPFSNIKVTNSGDLESERIEFFLTETYDIGHLIIADNTYDTNHKPSNKLRHMHAFRHLTIPKGDKVILWTKKGTDRTRKSSVGEHTRHHYHWNLDETIWNLDGDIAHLFDVRGAHNHVVSKFEE